MPKKILFKGTVASRGKARGPVKIVLGDFGEEEISGQLASVHNGDILITTMTRPIFTPVLKKIVALVTDKGGILCHAAMVSREFGIPCIVGAKVATSLLKNGQTVVVDAIEGVVYEEK